MARQEPKTGRRWFKEPEWMRGKLLLIAAGAATAGLVALAVVMSVFGGEGGAGTGDGNEAAGASPTVSSTPGDSGPPSVSGEPTVTASGLKIIDIVVGEGAQPNKGDKVSIDYTGWLSDGTKFDSTFDRGTPLEFTLGVGEVIQGSDEGIATMRVGGKRRLIMPADLAYGEQGVPPVIPPNAELTFDVELLEVKNAP